MIDKLKEVLADYAHRTWSGWMKYMFGKGILRCDGSILIPKWAVDRWSRQAETKYKDLPEPEKESDRAEADRIIKIFKEVT